MIDFSDVVSVTIPEGSVEKIAVDGEILWAAKTNNGEVTN